MASIRFVAKPDNGTLQIKAVFNDGDKAPTKNLGFSIPDNKVNGKYKYWDKKRYVLLLPEKDTINAKIKDWDSRFTNYKKFCSDNNIKVNIYEFKATLESPERQYTKGDMSFLVDIAADFVNSIKGTVAPQTVGQYETIIENLKAYEQKVLHQRIHVNIVNELLYKDFGLWLVKEEMNINNTVNRKITRIITIMNYAWDKKYINSKNYEKRYTFKKSPAKRFSLWAEEVDTLRAYKCKTDEDQVILDAFLFSCETTLRLSDIQQLYPGHRMDLPTKYGKIPTLDLTQIKTTAGNTIGLSDYAISIWDKYAKSNDEKIFNINNRATASEKLRVILDDAGIIRPCEIVRTKGNRTTREIKPLSDVISYHMSRNTAITLQLEELSPAIVMGNSGIKKMDTLLGYYRDNEYKRIAETLKKQNKTPAQE